MLTHLFAITVTIATITSFIAINAFIKCKAAITTATIINAIFATIAKSSFTNVSCYYYIRVTTTIKMHFHPHPHLTGSIVINLALIADSSSAEL